MGNPHSLAPGVRDVEERIGPQCVLQGVFVGAKVVVHLEYNKWQQDSTMISSRTLLATSAACWRTSAG